MCVVQPSFILITDEIIPSSLGSWFVFPNDFSLSQVLTPVQNHSCAPNCWIKNVVINEHTKRKSILALFTLEPVEENQELHFSYFGSLDGVRIHILIIPQGMSDHPMCYSGYEDRGTGGCRERKVLLRCAKMHWNIVPKNYPRRSREWRRGGKRRRGSR